MATGQPVKRTNKGLGRGLRGLLIAALLTVHAPAFASSLEIGDRATVASIVDGDTVVLDDAREVRLVGIQAPKLPLGRKGFKKWPLAEASASALERLVLGRVVELRYGGRRIDRYRRLLAHLFVDGETWVQGALLETGMARVYTFPDNRQLATEMYDREISARLEKRGIWSNAFYDLRGVNRLWGDVGTFQVIEGKVLKAARVRSRIYLNFGPEWKTDFTVVVPTKKLGDFQSVSVEPLELEGRWIRVRGWIRKWNGPMIDATHPEQIEIVSGGP